MREREPTDQTNSDTTLYEPKSHSGRGRLRFERPLLGAYLLSVGLIAGGGGVVGLARLITDNPSRAAGMEYVGTVTVLTGVLALFHQLRLRNRAIAEQR